MALKEQTEQMRSMLFSINQDKKEIQDIDELIRNEKWDEARKLIEVNEMKNKIEE